MQRDDRTTEQVLAAIRADLSYYAEAVRTSALGHQPPTVYASKYVEDVTALLDMLGAPPMPAAKADPPPDSVEGALLMDERVRTERRRR